LEYLILIHRIDTDVVPNSAGADCWKPYRDFTIGPSSKDSLGMPFDLETEQFLFRVVDRIVFHKPVLHSRVDAIARDGEGFSITPYIEHVGVEGVRAVKVACLAQPVCLWITEAPDILQPMITCEADGFEVLRDLSVGNAVREFLYQREAMV